MASFSLTISLKLCAREVLTDTEDWEIVPSADETRRLQGLASDQSISIDTSTSLLCHPCSPEIHKSDTFDSQTELAELEAESDSMALDSPTRRNRYSSPLFQELLKDPIEPVKISRMSYPDEGVIEVVKITRTTIPEDNSINVLLHAASLVSKSQKSHEAPASEPVAIEFEIISQTNPTKHDLVEREKTVDEHLLKTFSVPEKRPSLHDPEQVLMENVVPGECF